MKNNITEDYCSFEVSKLLKEKGFRCYTNRYYKQDGSIVINFEESSGEREYWFDADSFLGNWNDGRLADKDNNFCWGCKEGGKYFQCFSMPTHALAIKWIRENFKIHIWLENNAFGYIWKTNNASELPWEGDKRNNLHMEIDKEHKKPEEAVEAALLYTLKNLI